MIPYQGLHRCGAILIAARGPQIDTFNLQDGSYLSSWKCDVPSKGESQATLQEITVQKLTEKPLESDVIETESGPAAKRRKLSNEDNAESDIVKKEADSKIGEGKKKTPRPQKGSNVPNVVLLASTSDSQHVIAVTGEDKTLRVFKLSHESGILEQLSQR